MACYGSLRVGAAPDPEFTFEEIRSRAVGDKKKFVFGKTTRHGQCPDGMTMPGPVYPIKDPRHCVRIPEVGFENKMALMGHSPVERSARIE
jgi:hypothetical protein